MRTAMLSILVGVTSLTAQAADLGALKPSAQWLRTERLRGTLFHQPNIDPMPVMLTQPAVPGIEPGKSAPVVLRGRHYLRVMVDERRTLGLRLRNVEGSEHFAQVSYAVYSPAGEELKTGLVAPNRAQDVALKGLAPGDYVVLLDSGPASSSAAEVTVRNAHWAIDGGSRSEYLRSPMHYHFLRDLKLGGFNCAMVDVESLRQSFVADDGLAAWAGLVKRWTDYAAKVKLRTIVAIDLGGTSYEVEAFEGLPPGLYTEPKDDQPLAPCPLRREYWEALVLRRGREVSKLAQDNPYVVGYAIDPEMYQCWSYGHYMLTGTCFCDHCLGGFLKSKGLDTAILREKTTGKERYDWLVAQKLQGEYFDWLADQMADIAAWSREELHAIDPDLLWCVYVLEIGNWFCEGLARGLSEPDLPVINFCEHTYYSVGYDREWLDKTHQRFKDWGANVLQGSALWDLHFPPTRPSGVGGTGALTETSFSGTGVLQPGFLGSHAYNLAVNDEGWWYWPGDRLYRDWGATHAYLNEPAYFEDYWRDCAWANREIETTLKQAGRGSDLVQADVVPWKGKIKGGDIEAPAEIARAQNEPPASVCVAAPTTLYFVVPERAEEFSLRCQARKPGNAAVVTLRDPTGREAGSVRGELDAYEEIRPAVKPGVWSVEVKPDGDAPLKGVGLRLEGVPVLFGASPESLLSVATKKPGLIGCWPLDEGSGIRAADTSQPPPCDGVISGAKWTPGKIGQAVRFDGKSGAVTMPSNWAYNNLKAFSLSAWVRLDALPVQGNGATLVNKGPESPVQHFWWWIGYPPSYALTLEVGNEKHQWGTSFASGALTWELGRWYHVAAAFHSDGKTSTALLYRDGERVSERTLDEPFHSGAHDLKLGTYGGMHWLNGALDEVKLWDRALTDEEVAVEYAR
ncbi:MAG: LamG domain-containing protein [Armatimonadetes bacterium]|nr:LamG domain-containing protein [Armatimonadota bacterium]